MSNFQFLQTEFPSLFRKMKKAEERVFSEAVSTASYCRIALEECIYQLYELEYVEFPYNKDLVSLMNQEEIKRIIPYSYLSGLHIVRKTGNNAAHYGRRITSKEALISLKYLYTFLKWFAGTYSEIRPELPGPFNETFIPKIGAAQRQLKQQQKESEAEQRALQIRIDQLLKEKETLLEQAEQSEEGKDAIEEQRHERIIPVSTEFSEAETRKHLIDIDLLEAGWDKLNEGYELEYPVKGMPITSDNPNGNGFVDYVLWDDNGKPLALVEAKRSSKDPALGKHQAFLYANSLEKMHGQRPVIFYTNGYENHIWDDTFYSSPRRVHGFYTKEELRWLIQQRNTRKDIRQAKVDRNIAGRPYQIEAIQRISESFVVSSKEGLKGNKRSALLVMATGSGKTRTAAAMVAMLFKNNWVKRVLFLADRNALVRQAKRAFADFLPEISSIDLTEEKENNATRLVFSTYPSMMNRIDNIRNKDERFYGVGHFDLIIVDEAHRSVYNRYRSIFEYFDSLVVGLTATPKDSIDHNTFELFGCSNDDPTFSYELEQAVPTYLNPFENFDVSTKFLREGIKYNELSDREKEIYEETFEDKTTGLFPEEIAANAMNKWLFNKDTVNKVLDTLMRDGLRIEGGDKIGRTIIFAVNQKHAKFIEDCFTERYPELPSGFIAMIHNGVSHAQSLIDSFCDEFKENKPQIAISVDMLDTGIDAVRILNLVFFKVVRSYAKFWQMIGRGTRLCPDVFGPGQPKDRFLIFDVCQNFEFFEVNKKGKEGIASKPITQQLFEARLQLSRLLAETGELENIELASTLLDQLHQAINNLERKRFQVDMNLRYVEEFKARSRWNNLSADDVHQIESYLSALPNPEAINETARRFDLMMLKLQLASMLQLSSETRFHENLITIAGQLSTKYTIPQVLRSKLLIEQMKDPEFYKGISQKKLDSLRKEIRELVQYLEITGITPIYTDIEDSEITTALREPKTSWSGGNIYKKRVESFIRENKNQLTISKLATNKPITFEEITVLEDILFDGEERGTPESFKEEYGEQPLGKFVRSILGLDLEAANQAFADFIHAGKFSAAQMTFINNIIGYLTRNGTIDREMLFEAPFTNLNDQGLLGIFNDADAVKIINIIDTVNRNAEVA